MAIKFDYNVLKGRSELGISLTANRLYLIHRKRKLTAYIVLILLGGLAVHRFYLGRWKTGAALLIFYLFVIIVPEGLFMAGVSNPVIDSLITGLLLASIAVLIYEFAILWRLVDLTNENIKAEIETKTTFL